MRKPDKKTKKAKVALLSCLVKYPRTVLIVSKALPAGQTPKVSSNYPQGTRAALLSNPNKNILPAKRCQKLCLKEFGHK